MQRLTATILDFNAPLPATIYWDASFIVNFSHADSALHTESVAFLTRLKASATFSFVSTLALFLLTARRNASCHYASA